MKLPSVCKNGLSHHIEQMLSRQFSRTAGSYIKMMCRYFAELVLVVTSLKRYRKLSVSLRSDFF